MRACENVRLKAVLSRRGESVRLGFVVATDGDEGRAFVHLGLLAGYLRLARRRAPPLFAQPIRPKEDAVQGSNAVL